MTGLTFDERKAATTFALADPKPGDRYHEMYSFWMYVVAVEPGGRVATLSSGAPCRFPDDGELCIYGSVEEFRTYWSWVLLADRGNDVEGWFRGWPQSPTLPDCPRCAARLAVAAGATS